MLKKLFILFACCVSSSTFAFSNCPQAVPTNSASFCSSFKSVAQCHCTEAGLPSAFCQNMNTIYDRMIAVYGSVDRACTVGQHDTTAQICMDDWKCYRTGGQSSQGACSGTGRACP